MRKISVFLAGVLGFGLLGCERDADSLSRVARCAAAKGEAVAKDSGAWQVVQANLDELTLDARVAARLRWDKSLEGAEIQVRIATDGIELSGRVKSEQQRKRALELAESTAGVGKVTDALEIIAP